MREDLWFVRFDDPRPGADCIRMSEEFRENRFTYNFDARQQALVPLDRFVVYKGPDGGLEDRWFPASEGLEAVRGLLKHYRGPVESSPVSGDVRREARDRIRGRKIGPLEVLEALLVEADGRGVKFFIAHRD